MIEFLNLLGAVQANGGMLLMLAYLVWIMRQHRSDFIHHDHDEEGKPFVKKRASDLSS